MNACQQSKDFDESLLERRLGEFLAIGLLYLVKDPHQFIPISLVFLLIAIPRRHGGYSKRIVDIRLRRTAQDVEVASVKRYNHIMGNCTCVKSTWHVISCLQRAAIQLRVDYFGKQAA